MYEWGAWLLQLRAWRATGMGHTRLGDFLFAYITVNSQIFVYIRRVWLANMEDGSGGPPTTPKQLPRAMDNIPMPYYWDMQWKHLILRQADGAQMCKHCNCCTSACLHGLARARCAPSSLHQEHNLHLTPASVYPDAQLSKTWSSSSQHSLLWAMILKKRKGLSGRVHSALLAICVAISSTIRPSAAPGSGRCCLVHARSKQGWERAERMGPGRGWMGLPGTSQLRIAPRI